LSVLWVTAANQQQQLNDWCSHQLPSTSTSGAEQTSGPSTEEHHPVGLLAGHDRAGSVEVCMLHTAQL